MESKIVVPALGESIVEATVMQWLKKTGEPVKAGEPVVELETDKINLEVAAEQSGVLAQIERKEGEDVRVGDELGLINTEQVPVQASTPAPVAGKEKAASTSEPAPAAAEKASLAAAKVTTPTNMVSAAEEKVTPLARRVAEDYSIDLNRVQGSGAGGRILRKDV
jgi:2-oxoglutarate dehydrogenase E2 component (dihydrolipoamide succinyltransferase)